MKLTEQHIFKGYWWLPENPDCKIAGVLTYSPSERILLELIGGFESKEGAIKGFLDTNSEVVPMIHGIDSNAKEISLASCHSTFSYNFSSEFPIVRYTAQLMVYDKHIDSLDEICQYTAEIRFPELSYWAPPSVIRQVYHYNQDGDDIDSCTFHLPRLVEDEESFCRIQCDNGVVLSIKRSIRFQPGELMLKPELEQYSYVEIKKPETGIGIRDILHEMYKVGQFLSLVTKRNVRPESICLRDPDIRQVFGEKGKSYYFPIYVLKVFTPVPNPGTIDRNKFLFCYEDISGKLPVLLSQWMSDSDDLQPIKSHLVDSLVYKPIVGSVDFLQVVQAIEGVWWRFRDDGYRASHHTSSRTGLKTIIREILGSLSKIPSIGKLNIDIDAVVDSRNYYSHFVEKAQKPKTLDGWALYELTKDLRKVLLCLVLELLGLDHGEIERILVNQI